MKLILASGSKDRRKLLENIGVKFDILKTNAKEISFSTDVSKYVMDLATIKAETAKEKIEKAVIIAADTIVYSDKKILEKPKSKEEAINMVYQMSNGVQEVWTGVAIYDLYQDKKIIFSEKTDIYLTNISKEEAIYYVENDEDVYNRAGAYAIDGKNAFFTEKIDGDYANVIGLPVCRIYKELKKLGYELKDFM